MSARDTFAMAGARATARISRLAGFSGTSLPGLLAQRLSPGIVGRLAARLGPIALVSGTNGKTTTSLTLANVLRATGHDVLANASGANLGQAIGTAIVGSPGRRRWAVFEVDEAALPALLDEVPARVLVLTNIFRDQLDRFGETDRIVRIWRSALEGHAGPIVVYCADDPRLAALLAGRRDARGYGFVERPPSGSSGDTVTTDVTTCPVCGGPLLTAWTTIGHLGDYRCEACGFRRPPLWLSVRVVEDHGLHGQVLGFGLADGATLETPVMLIGTANAYNAAAALASAVTLGVELRAAVSALAHSGPAFARWESLVIDGRRVVLSLVKNPASLDEVTRAGSAALVDGVLFSMNDQHADGRDVSWYWDADPTPLVPGRLVAMAGARAPDMLLRLRYQLLAASDEELPGLVGLYERPIDGLDALLREVPEGGSILVVSTYTALLGLRAALVRRGLLTAMPT